MKNYINSLLCLILVLFNLTLRATDLNTYGFDMGLSHRNVLHINQDQSGFLWLGTINGLNRFDGYTFRKFSLEDSANTYDSHAVYEINFDDSNNLILSLTNRLIKMHPSGEILKVVDFGKADFQRGSERQIRNLIRTEYGWWGVLKDASDFSFSLVELNEDLEITFQWDLGLVNDVELIEKQNEHLYFYQNHRYLKSFNTADYSISYSIETPVHTSFCYAGAPVFIDNIGLQDLGGNILEPISAELLFKLDHADELHVVSQEGKRLIFCTDRDLFALDLLDGSIEYLSDKINDNIGHEVVFHDLFIDNTDLLWVSSNFGAISIHFDSQDFEILMSGGDILCSSDYCSMRGVTQDSLGTIYCSFYNSICAFDGKTNKRQDLGFQIKDNPYALLWHDGKLFSGSGLVVDLSSNTLIRDLELEEEGVLTLFAKDSLYLFNGGSVFLWEEGSSQYKKLSTFDKIQFTYVVADHGSQIIYLGTKSKGIWIYNPSTGALVESGLNKANSSFSNRRINVIATSLGAELFVGTDRGIFHFKGDKLIRVFDSKEQGLPNDFINGLIVEEDRYLWFSTDNGLGGIDLETRRSFEINQNMIPFSEFNRISFAALKDGSFVFGGLNGMVRFHPSKVRNKLEALPKAQIMITEIQKYNGRSDSLEILNEQFISGDTLRVAYFDAFFQIYFTSSAYENPKKNSFRYKLVGYDKEWISSSEFPSVRYNFVPAGTYTFQVEGDAYGAQEEILPLQLNIIIEQAFFRELWFIVLSIFSALACIVVLLWWRIKTINKRAEILEIKVDVRTKELQQEKQKSEDLLLNILPYEVAEELKEHGTTIAKKYSEVTVLFTDFKGFTKIATNTEPEALVSEIDYCFRAFDEIITRYSLEKIKTIGDAYLCVGGIDEMQDSQARQVIMAALDIQLFMEKRKKERQAQGAFYFEIRLGIHTGPIIAGIVGLKKFAFDIWGDTVNTASHIESSSEVGCINISKETFDLIESDFDCTYRGKVEMKNKEPIDMFFVDQIKKDSTLLNIYEKEALAEEFN